MLVAHQRSIVILAVAGMLGACAEPTAPTAVSAPKPRAELLGSIDYSIAAVDYTLTSFDFGTLTLSGQTTLVNLLPPSPILPPNPIVPPNPIFTFNASFAQDTRLYAASLDGYIPNDPVCPAIAANYNAILNLVTSDGGLFYATISDMAANRCNARVLVDLQTATIRSFQPVP
jgi:hypothetical protein